jgi:hypothetical protein
MFSTFTSWIYHLEPFTKATIAPITIATTKNGITCINSFIIILRVHVIYIYWQNIINPYTVHTSRALLFM